jgi:tRNA(Arg) A34 adenosine deaminase TadA
MFSTQDKAHMQLALSEARAALASGDYPVGAVLTVDGELWGSARNALFTEGRTTAHAEHNLIASLSSRLRAKQRINRHSYVCLYTTLEPCLMCLGIAVLHRVSRIIIACPDPNGGTTALDVRSLGSVYQGWWPTIDTGLYQTASCQLIIEFLRTEKFFSWQTMLMEFEQLQAQWQQV